MTPEATKFVDGVFGSVADDKREPVWKGYFTAFKIGGDRGYRVTPGYWVVMDERPETLSQLRLESNVGRPTLVRNGQPVDMNYVVLDLMLQELAEG